MILLLYMTKFKNFNKRANNYQKNQLQYKIKVVEKSFLDQLK